MGKAFARLGNRIAVRLYRSSDGRLVGKGVLMLTVPGRRTGLPRSTCVRFLDTSEGPVVWGTGSGSPRDPDWVRNLRCVEHADVQLGGRSRRVRPRELGGGERDAVWTGVVLARAPGVARYARKAGRVIPVFLLRPE